MSRIRRVVFCVRSAVVIEEVVRTARQFADLVHVVLDNVGQALIPGVIGFAGLEEHIRVGNGTAHNRMFRVQGALAMFIDFILRQQAEKGIIRQRGDFVDFVRSAETIKEMNKRHPALQGGDMRDQREILRFLNAAGAQHG